MNSSSHPILIELSQQLPETSTAYKSIHGAESYLQIISLAKAEFSWLSNLDAGSGQSVSNLDSLNKNGYENLLDDEEDRLIFMGTLKMIIELAEELED
ncbi:MAG: hypothetical protein HOH38_01880 [Nitrospinaceae bacterium]|jgi:hypothetical protein|nr:hypothetical protein [Nitrospina sp.]MBT5867568.1 hypothetical protein [Nitrospinaceae bacterium]